MAGEKTITFNKRAFDFEVIKVALFDMRVCSNCPPERKLELEDAVRLMCPAGTTENWHLNEERGYEPVECERGGRWHYMFRC